MSLNFPEVGFEFRFWGGTENRQYLHICVITEVIPVQRLCHTWSYEETPGITELCFEITPAGDNLSKLKLSHAGFETFPADNPDLDLKNFDEGWEYILGTPLKNYLEKKLIAGGLVD
ncbi:MAG: hypothetical protein FD181_178 [Prolixibacteraceae bacterium]|nr:MAG: hypothetical protein FD181_178 [Prolixibacteraceae bacterium]